jgi:molybdopterin molybdotransferase
MSETGSTRGRRGDEMLHPTVALGHIASVACPVTETQSLPLGSANGRILAHDVATAIPLPPFDSSAVDGYGIAASDVNGTPLQLSVASETTAGAPPGPALRAGEALRILTGAVVPSGVAAIVMDEMCKRDGDQLTVTVAVPDGANIRHRGEDVAEGSNIVGGGTLVDARHIAILAAAGISEVEVLRPIRVGVLSNGNELRESDEALAPGQIHDTNRPMLMAMLASRWIEVIDLGRHPDDMQVLSRVMAEGCACADVIISSGGVTGSDADHIGRAVVAAGGDLRSFRMAIKPGKPILAGRIGHTAMLGLPGNPVSALVDFLLFGRPLLAATAGLPVEYPAGRKAIAAASYGHALGRTEFIPARLVGLHETGCPLVQMLSGGGAARLRPLVDADGLVEIASDMAEVRAGALITFHPLPNSLVP